MKNQRTAFLLVLAIAAILLVSPQPIFSAIVVDPDGVGATDIDPADPETWTSGFSGTNASVGKTSSGELRVDGGSQIESNFSWIGNQSGSTGIVTVDGIGSTWTNSSSLDIGDYGSGTLNITGGGAVSNFSGNIGSNFGSSGAVRVDGIDSTWTNSHDLRVESGTLDITGGGAVSNTWADIGGFSSTGFVQVDGTGSTWTNSSHLYFNNGTLDISGGGAVSNTWAQIGDNHGSTSTVSIDGTDSTWTISGYLYVNNGTLDITGGGAVSNEGVYINDNAYIGHYSGSDGAVRVDGPGSSWINSRDLYVGYDGNGTLDIINGGLITVVGTTHVGSQPSGQGTINFNGGTLDTGLLQADDANLTGTGTILLHDDVIVDDSLTLDSLDDFIWHYRTIDGEPNQNITVSLVINDQVGLGAGAAGTGSLTISGGLAVASTHGCIGRDATATGTMSINGSDSTWTISNDLNVGYQGRGTLDITGGGSVSNSWGYVGHDSGSDGIARIDGPGSSWANNNSLYVGYQGRGTLDITRGGVVSNSWGYIGHDPSSDGTVRVDGPGSSWTNSRDIYVGYQGRGTLDITGGGEVSNAEGHIGLDSSSDGTVRVNGAASTWINSDSLSVGYRGRGTLDITGGGTVSNSTSYIGHDSDSDGIVRVDGSGSTWTSSYYDLRVGYQGRGTLDITNGGAVSNGEGYIGYKNGSTGTMRVDGTDSTWTNRDELYVGYSGNGSLNITRGGAVISNNAYFQQNSYIGYESGSTGSVIVDGIGSTWANGDDLYVGYSGSGTLDIANGGLVTVADTTHTTYSSGSQGTINFNGGTLETGLLWANDGDMRGTGTIILHGVIADYALVLDSPDDLTQSGYRTINSLPGQNITVDLHVDGLGNLGAGLTDNGSLSINSGLTVTSKHGYLGWNVAANGTATVDGTGSTWTNSGNLIIGYEGGGMLNVTNGGTVSNEYGCIGFGSSSTGSVSVDGVTSTWTNSYYDLRVGYQGRGTLDITGGGAVSNSDGYIGNEFGSTGTVNVDGTDSTWTNSDKLIIGDEGSGMLNITNGGTVSNEYGCIGFGSSSAGCVSVDGTGSTWTNSYSNFDIGYQGSGSLTISGGGAVSSFDGYIGHATSSTGVVIVDGVESTWTNSNTLIVGIEGSGTLNITDGGLVSVSGALRIDYDGDGDGFINMASGGMLALHGDADDSLVEFLGLVSGTDAINYWDYSISDWADITGATYGDDYTLSYLSEGALNGYTVLTLSMPAPTMAGDANCDGVVNDSDAAVLAAYWLKDSGAIWGMGDFNGDGAVNQIDATLLAANWQSGVEQSVPEPSAFVGLLGLCLAGMLGWGRRKR